MIKYPTSLVASAVPSRRSAEMLRKRLVLTVFLAGGGRVFEIFPSLAWFFRPTWVQLQFSAVVMQSSDVKGLDPQLG